MVHTVGGLCLLTDEDYYTHFLRNVNKYFVNVRHYFVGLQYMLDTKEKG